MPGLTGSFFTEGQAITDGLRQERGLSIRLFSTHLLDPILDNRVRTEA